MRKEWDKDFEDQSPWVVSQPNSECQNKFLYHMPTALEKIHEPPRSPQQSQLPQLQPLAKAPFP